jgi:hypothetical protein
MLSPPDFRRVKLSMTMGNGGQTSNIFLTSVLSEQTSRRLRRCGDPNIRFRHFRHTCTSVCHQFSALDLLDLTTRKSNISRRTSSGRMSIVIRPTWRQSVVQLLQDFGPKKTYVDFVLFVGSESRDVCSFRTATRSLASYHLFALMTQDREMTVSRGWGMLGRLRGGDAFEHGYLRHLSIIGQYENFPSTYC